MKIFSSKLNAIKRTGGRFFLILAVFVFVLAIFNKVLFDHSPSEVSYVDQFNIQLNEIYQSKKNLPEEQQILADLSKDTYCQTTGYLCYDDPTKYIQSEVDRSTAGVTASIIAYPFVEMPASGVGSTLAAFEKAGIVPEAYAAEGIGRGSITSYVIIWEQMRNIAMLLIVIFILAAGFMIMFRNSLDANTAIGIESILPKVIIALILIQMSFAIAGFFIDIMYIVSAFVVTTLGPLAIPGESRAQMIDEFVFAQPVALWTTILGPGGLTSDLFRILYEIPTEILKIFGNQWRFILQFLLTLVIGAALFDSKSELASSSVSQLSNIKRLLSSFTRLFRAISSRGWMAMLGEIAIVIMAIGKLLPVIITLFAPQIFIGLFLLFSLIVAAYKVFLLLIKTYLKIVLLIIFAPILILLDVIPNRSGFKPWAIGLMSELFVFPILMGLMLISFIIAGTDSVGDGLKLPFLFNIDGQAFAYIISIVFLAMTPSFIEKTKDAIFGNPYSGFSQVFSNAPASLMQGIPIMSRIGNNKIGRYIPGLKTANKIAAGTKLVNRTESMEKSADAARLRRILEGR